MEGINTKDVFFELPPEKKTFADDVQDQLTAGCFAVAETIVGGVLLLIQGFRIVFSFIFFKFI